MAGANSKIFVGFFPLFTLSRDVISLLEPKMRETAPTRPEPLNCILMQADQDESERAQFVGLTPAQLRVLDRLDALSTEDRALALEYLTLVVDPV